MQAGRYAVTASPQPGRERVEINSSACASRILFSLLHPKDLGAVLWWDRRQKPEASVQTGSTLHSPEMGHKLKHVQASRTCYALSPQRNLVVAHLG